MSYTPEAELKEGDRVLLTGKSWAEDGLEGERVVTMAEVPTLEGTYPSVEGYWVLDPEGMTNDWSVTRVGAGE